MRFCNNRVPVKDREIAIISFLIAAVLTAAICLLFAYDSAQRRANENPPIFFYDVQGKSYIQLLFVGDMMFDRGIEFYAGKNKGNDFIFDKISKELSNNDLVIGNLEGPITDKKSVSSGTAPGSVKNYFFTFDPSWAGTLFKNNIKLVDLGNNHIMNFGHSGLVSTEKYLGDAGVDFFGAPDGNKSVIEDIDGVKVAFVSYNEFSGAAPADEQTATINEIKKVKLAADAVVVFCHWGVEYSLVPTAAQKDLAHKFVDSGADLIIGAHPHVIETVEDYNGKKIYYSLGNFIFDQHFSEDVRNGLGVSVKIDKATAKMDFTDSNFYLSDNGQTIDKTAGK